MFKHTEDAKRRISESIKKQYKEGTRKKVTAGSETAKKISTTIKNKVKNGEYTVWHKGKQLPEWVKEKLSKAHTGQKGKDHPRWKGGITPEVVVIRHSEDYKKWRNDVFVRDNYTCVFCGIVGGKLDADHILLFSKYPDKRLDVNNGRTLCIKCHKRRHSLEGDRGEPNGSYIKK